MPLALDVASSLIPIAGKRRAVAHPGNANSLPLQVEHQNQYNWCWAAVSVSVKRFFDATFGETQCEQANAILGRVSCCGPDGADEQVCNVTHTLDPVLSRLGVLRRVRSGFLSFEEIETEIDAGRPVACFIGWTGGGGHFVCIAGYDAGPRTLAIRDPLFDPSTLPYDEFVNSYQHIGSWSFTYFVQR